MEQKDLISQIKKLREIEPRKDWVLTLKKEILKEEVKAPFLFSFKIPLVLASLLILISFSFVFAKNSLPGDFLYPLKITSEKLILTFTPQEEKPKLQLEITKTRLEELKKIAKENKIEKLTPAIKEVKKSLPVASQTIKEVLKEKEDIKKVKEIAKKVKEIERETEEVKSLGIVIDSNKELEKSTNELKKVLVENEIKDLEKRTLTQPQKEMLEKIKESYNNGDYNKALELIFFLRNK